MSLVGCPCSTQPSLRHFSDCHIKLSAFILHGRKSSLKQNRPKSNGKYIFKAEEEKKSLVSCLWKSNKSKTVLLAEHSGQEQHPPGDACALPAPPAMLVCHSFAVGSHGPCPRAAEPAGRPFQCLLPGIGPDMLAEGRVLQM